MTQQMSEIVEEIVRRIVAEADPEQIILFGSCARDETGSDSDVDLLVVESEPFEGGRSRYKEMVRLERATGRLRVPTDILVFTSEEIEFWRDSINHVVGRALRQGRVLYARP